jgi:7-carboxy-7-deazaguanine synthase (Cx14CxxC type)
MPYSVKEIFYTLQGEGFHTGRPAVFLRFAGCNLWNGHEDDRADALCPFCDTDFIGTNGSNGGQYETPAEIAEIAANLWPQHVNDHDRYIVCTGGEPLLQLNTALIEALHRYQFEIAIETNGTLPVPEGIDWICVSPKANTELVAVAGDELKLVYPQKGLDPESMRDLEFDHFSLQPMDGPELDTNTALAASYCLQHPQWHLSLQTHKFIGLP